MRAPPDSTKPITGTRERPASSSTRTTVSACASPSEPPANEASCANRRRRARRRARRRRAPRRRAAPSPPAPREHLGAQQVERSRVAEHLQALERREPLLGSWPRNECGGHAPPDRARRCGRRSRTSWRSRPAAASRLQRARALRDVVEVELRVGLLVARAWAGSAVDAAQDRRDRLDRAGGAEQVPDRRLGRGDGDRRGVLAERGLQRGRLGAVVERRRGAVGVDVDDVLG